MSDMDEEFPPGKDCPLCRGGINEWGHTWPCLKYQKELQDLRVAANAGTAQRPSEARRKPCPVSCDCLCHDTGGGVHDHPGEPCPGKLRSGEAPPTWSQCLVCLEYTGTMACRACYYEKRRTAEAPADCDCGGFPPATHFAGCAHVERKRRERDPLAAAAAEADKIREELGIEELERALRDRPGGTPPEGASVSPSLSSTSTREEVAADIAAAEAWADRKVGEYTNRERATKGHPRVFVVAVASLITEVRNAERLSPTYTTGDRLRDVIDENFGMQPVMSDEDALTFLERKLFEQRQTAEGSCASGGTTRVEPKAPVKIAEPKRSPVVRAASPAASATLNERARSGPEGSADVSLSAPTSASDLAGPNASVAGGCGCVCSDCLRAKNATHRVCSFGCRLRERAAAPFPCSDDLEDQTPAPTPSADTRDAFGYGDHVRCTHEVLVEHRGRGGVVKAQNNGESLVQLDGTERDVWFFNKHLRLLRKARPAPTPIPPEHRGDPRWMTPDERRAADSSCAECERLRAALLRQADDTRAIAKRWIVEQEKVVEKVRAETIEECAKLLIAEGRRGSNTAASYAARGAAILRDAAELPREAAPSSSKAEAAVTTINDALAIDGCITFKGNELKCWRSSGDGGGRDKAYLGADECRKLAEAFALLAGQFTSPARSGDTKGPA